MIQEKTQYEKVRPTLEKQMVAVWEKMSDDLEMYPYEVQDGVSEVEYKSRDGFMSFIDGGFLAEGYVDLHNVNSEHKKVMEVAEKDLDFCYEGARKQFIDDNPELVKEVGEDSINYHDLYALGKGTEAERLSECEYSWMNDTAFKYAVQLHFYESGNRHNELDTDSIYVCSYINWEAPYYRPSKGHKDREYVCFQGTISASGDYKTELNTLLSKAVNELVK
jgi:hypothetical protein